jgi:uncharacterized sporulation protein YeaH/YhbH (DUF444 family)
MLKSVLGEEATTSLFSADYALELFMGWDKDKIELNKQMKFKEMIEAAKMTFIKTKIEETGTIDFKLDPDNGKSFSEILRDGLDESFLETGETSDEEGEGAEGEGDEFSDESTGDEFEDDGSGEAAADEGGEEA